MKKFKLFNFKSIVQSKARWLLTLFAILTIGVGQMWAYEFNFPYVYFYNSSGTEWEHTMLFVFGSNRQDQSWGKGSEGYDLADVTGTKLKYTQAKTNMGPYLNGFSYGFGNTSGWKYESGDNWTSRWKYMTDNYSHSGTSQISLTYGTWYCTSSGSSNLVVTDISSDDSYSDLNSTQTLYTVVKTTGSSYTSGNSKATISMSSYELTGQGATTQRTPSLSTSESSETVSACRTATTVFTVGDLPTGYQFDGFWTAENEGSRLESGTTYTYYPTAATTVYARFSLTNYTITYDLDGGTNHASNPDSYTYETAAITLEDPTKSGYTFEGWYTNSTKTTEGHTVPTNSTGNKKFWAKWSENDYTVTVNAGAGGTVATSSVTAHMDTKETLPTATPYFGYRFTGWTVTSGSASFSSEGSADAAQIYGVSAEGVVVQANFTRVYAFIEGRFHVTNASRNGSWTNTFTSGNWVETSTLIPFRYDDVNHRYYLHTYATPSDLTTKLGSPEDWPYFFIKLLTSESDGSAYYTHYWSKTYQTFSGTDAGYTNRKPLAEKEGANNNLRFDATYNDAYVVLYFDGSDIWYELEQRLQYDGNGSDGGSTPSANNTYYLNGSTTSAATNTYTKDGYSFMGWNTQADGNGTSYAEGASITMSADVKLYAIWSENLCTVTINANETDRGTITVDDESFTWGNTVTVSKATGAELEVTPAEGYYFTGWTLSSGDFEIDGTPSDESNTSPTLSGKGNILASTGTLTANFEKLEKIYFRNDNNNSDWDKTHIYVYFNVGYNSTGVSSDAVATTSYYAEMSDADDDGIYEGFVPRAVTKNEYAAIAFSNEWMSSSAYPSGLWDHFYGKHGVYRTDYNKKLNMYVLKTPKSGTSNSTDYYNNGYWMNYNQQAGDTAGYQLKRWRKSTNDYRKVGEFLATDNPNIIKLRFRVDSLSSQTGRSYYDQYIVYSAGSIKYKASSTITIGARTNVTVADDNNTNDTKFVLTPTKLGYYVITIDQSGNQMKMSVNYPVDVNDYILEHQYTDPKGNTVTTHSDVIKYDSAANVARYSMYLSKGKAGSTSTLTLRKCTAMSAGGTPTWGTGDATNLSGILTTLASKGNGVYQFDLSVDKTNNRVDAVVADSTRLYTGKYYIKTDTVAGGWINYKRNGLAHNTLTFKNTDSTTYDYYYCHYYYPQSSSASAARLKCVIANDYCNELCDTLKGDAFTDTYDGEAVVHTYQQNSQWRGTSVRFSYNSATNKLQRTYLAASLDNYYLDLDVKESGYVFKTDGTSPLYYATHDDTWATNCRFNDSLDWVYEMNVKVIPMGKAGVVAKYKSKTQQLLPKDYLLLGCGDGSTCMGKYLMNLVYDFKTNYLMASWIPDGDINEHLEKVDMLWERVADNSAQQITFGGSGSLEKVKVVGAIRFDYNTTHSGAIDFSTWNAESRPYLKYFVSFPFDVPVSSIFGLAEAELGRDYVIQKYNGAKRAKEGLFFGDGGNFWEDLTKDSVMHANEGYCIMFDNDYVRGDLGKWWTNKGAGSRVYLYFPAKDTIASITGSVETTVVAPHKCNSTRWFYELDDELHLKKKYHSQTDSHWNLIGSPKFQDAYIDFYSEGTATQTDTVGLNLTSYYYMDFSDDNKWKIQAIDHNTCFKAMHSYWVQWTGKIQWTTSPVAPPASAPAKNKAQAKNSRLKLDLMYNGKATDWTYVNMVEGADEDFKLCEDMTKVYNRNSSHIYTFAGNYDVAYNKLPIGNRTVNVGVGIYRSGTYTFAMPDSFDGVVILVDNETGTRTNLAAGNYEVYLNKGTYNERFALEIGVYNTPTDIEDVQSDDVQGTKARKVVVDGVLYIVKDGKVYDAQGNRVK